jgi:hypothetical protein
MSECTTAPLGASNVDTRIDLINDKVCCCEFGLFDFVRECWLMTTNEIKRLLALQYGNAWR